MSQFFPPRSVQIAGTAGTTVPNGSFTASISIPAGAVAAWAIFDDNVDIVVEHDGDTDALEAINSCAGWSLFPGGMGVPLAAAYGVKFKGDGAATAVTVFYVNNGAD